MSLSFISKNLKELLNYIETLKTKHSLKQNVKLIAISKTFTEDYILEAFKNNQTLFGENKVQEAETKINSSALLPYNLEWHLVGRLQSNKAKKATALFSHIHSVDSLKLATRLSQYASDLQKPLSILLQVNTSLEESKQGYPPNLSFLTEEAHKILGLPFLKLTGLMTIGPLSKDEKKVRKSFEQLRILKEDLNTALPQLNLTELSMGMSNDYPLALNEGATYIRVGSLIFGKRNYPL